MSSYYLFNLVHNFVVLLCTQIPLQLFYNSSRNLKHFGRVLVHFNPSQFIPKLHSYFSIINHKLYIWKDFSTPNFNPAFLFCSSLELKISGFRLVVDIFKGWNVLPPFGIASHSSQMLLWPSKEISSTSIEVSWSMHSSLNNGSFGSDTYVYK